MPVTISDDILQQAEFSEKELMLEIAIVFYQKQKFSIGQSAKFAGLSILQMHDELAKRGIPLNITPEDVMQDWQTLQRLSHR